ncbi:hypothetical protein Tco_0327801 [Tanacetum coccineum]
MRADELHKFSDGMLNDVRSALHDIVAGIRMEYCHMREMVFPMVAAARRGRVRFIAACSYSTDNYKDIMKAQVHVSKTSATLILHVLLEATKC